MRGNCIVSNLFCGKNSGSDTRGVSLDNPENRSNPRCRETEAWISDLKKMIIYFRQFCLATFFFKPPSNIYKQNIINMLPVDTPPIVQLDEVTKGYVPRSMSNKAAFAPSTSTRFPEFNCWKSLGIIFTSFSLNKNGNFALLMLPVVKNWKPLV